MKFMALRDCIEKILYDTSCEKINNGIIVNSPNGHRLTVAMHPYFKDREHFIWKMDGFLKNYKGPVLIFEEVTKIWQTYNRMKDMGVKGNRHFVITNTCSPYLWINSGMEWGDVLDKVNNLRNGEPVNLTGGYFDGEIREFSNKNYDYRRCFGGCLGVFATMLRDNQVPVDFLKDLVFFRHT